MDTLTLEQLLEQITDENIHPEIDTAPAVGYEE
jgi:antitoxin component of MazEF toxin-antitoxin module